ncbi:anti-anti-sigma factor [Saccharopolyspora lacisalsi]|uniref:Anti-anti-sigma factor n=2 Tax=Halosaccharopolyspora lacisalsi TaxID=1000566 RepID=A0A839E1U7_9PSEU|nr:anti-anti-sigma factor [Halosaccharopolyspora lacisalsi]
MNENVPFRMTVERPRDGVIVMSVAGALDMVTVTRFSRLLLDRLSSTVHVIVLDLSEVSFLGVEAIKVLAQADLRAQIEGKRLSLVTGVRAVDRPLEVLGMSTCFTYGSRPVFGAPDVGEFVPERRAPRAEERVENHAVPRQQQRTAAEVVQRA